MPAVLSVANGERGVAFLAPSPFSLLERIEGSPKGGRRNEEIKEQTVLDGETFAEVSGEGEGQR